MKEVKCIAAFAVALATEGLSGLFHFSKAATGGKLERLGCPLLWILRGAHA